MLHPPLHTLPPPATPCCTLPGLFFSRTYVPSCHRFLPSLKQCYESIRSVGLAFEVVYINLETDQQKFEEYFAEQPWAALPFGSEHAAKLAKRFCKPGTTL